MKVNFLESLVHGDWTKSITFYLISLLGGLVLIGIVSFSLLSIFLSLSILLCLPGFLLVQVLISEQKWDLLQRLPLYFGGGLGAFALVSTFAYLLQLSLNSFIRTLGVLWGVGLIICITQVIGQPSRENLKGRIKGFLRSPGPSWSFPQVIVALVALGSGIWMFQTGAINGGDVPFHLSIARRLLTNGITPFGHIAKTDGILVVYGYNAWHAVLAALSQLNQLNPDQVWAYLPALLVPVSFLAWYSLSIELFQDSNAAALSTLLTLVPVFLRIKTTLKYLGDSMGKFTGMAYPFGIAFYILVPIAIVLYIRSVRFPNKNLKWLIALSIIGISFVHPPTVSVVFLAIFCFIVVSWGVPRINTKQVLNREILTGLFLIPLPFLLGRAYLYLTYISSHDLVQQVTQGVKRDISLHFVNLGSGLSIINPQFLITPLVIGQLIAAPWLVGRIRQGIGERFLLSNILLILLMLLNPLTVYVLMRAITPHLLRRFGLRWLAMIGLLAISWWGAKILLPWLLNLLQNKMGRRVELKKPLAFAISALLLSFLITGGLTYQGVELIPSDTFSAQLIKPGSRHRQCERPLIEYLDQFSETDSTILLHSLSTRVGVAKSIIMCTGRHVVWERPNILVFSKVDTDERARTVQAIFDGEAEDAAVASFIREHDIDYLLLNRENKLFLESRYQSLSQFLQPVYEQSELHLYLIKSPPQE